jgi:hypothetical protein
MRILITTVVILMILATVSILVLGGFHYGEQYGYANGYEQGFKDGGTVAIKTDRIYEINFVLERMAFYESSFNVRARGDFDGKRYLAYGLYQFHRPTFSWLSRISGNSGLEYKNPDHQRVVAEWAVLHGYGYLWKTTYNKALHDYFMMTAPGGV